MSKNLADLIRRRMQGDRRSPLPAGMRALHSLRAQPQQQASPASAVRSALRKAQVQTET